jgi:hypothetical protein
MQSPFGCCLSSERKLQKRPPAEWQGVAVVREERLRRTMVMRKCSYSDLEMSPTIEVVVCVVIWERRFFTLCGLSCWIYLVHFPLG